VFELSPNAGGGWTEKVLHSFKNNGNDGSSSYASLIFDGVGNLYGTTAGGGAKSLGTVFELRPKTGGGWTEKLLHSFIDSGKDGYYPEAGLIFDASGNLYGTTAFGGSGSCTDGCGTVFELTPKTGGGWTEKILHNLNNNGKDGYYPFARGLIFDGAGNLYGTTESGGSGSCRDGCGTVFELTPKTGGGWTEKVLYNFKNNSRDGRKPGAGLIFDASGNLYGTTYGGGHGGGTVFEITP
jgi:uncharacterized repeat protein (TIGR03803 family)